MEGGNPERGASKGNGANRAERVAVVAGALICVPAILVAGWLFLATPKSPMPVEPQGIRLEVRPGRPFTVHEAAVPPPDPVERAVPDRPAPVPYSGPIFAAKKDSVRFRVPKREPPPGQEGPPPKSKEVPLETLPYFRRKAEARAETLFKMGRGLEKARKPAAALRYYQQVADDFPETPAAEQAKGRIEALQAR